MKNPFETSSIEHFPEDIFFDPQFFVKRDQTKFTWPIEHMSEVNPADISGNQPAYILENQK